MFFFESTKRDTVQEPNPSASCSFPWSWRRLGRLSAILAVTIAFASNMPAANAQAVGTSITLEYPTPGAYKQMMADIINQFSQKHPEIHVEVLAPSQDYETIVSQIQRSALIGDPVPDVTLEGLNRVSTLVAQDLAVPIDGFINREPNWASLGYIPSMQDLTKVGGKRYGLSFAVSSLVVYYNADLVQRAGGDIAHLPKTWPDLLTLATKINALGNGSQGVYWYYYESNGNWSFHNLVQSYGGSMMSPDEKEITFNQLPGMAALKLVSDFGRAGMVDMTDAQATQLFSAGKLGIYITSSSRTASLDAAASGHFKMIAAPLPIAADNATFPAGGSAVVMHTKDPNKQAAAWEFMKFAAGPIGQTIMAKKSGYMPGNQLALDDPTLLGRFYDDHPNDKAAIAQLARMTQWFSFPGKNSLEISPVIRDYLQLVVTEKRTPAAAMPDMVHDVAALLAN